MKNVLVTGGNGQLASCIKDVSLHLNDFNFIYVDVEELDITKNDEVNAFFENNLISYCINCAAYTAVDLAESNEKLAKSVNVVGSANLATACAENNAILMHVSTDFVFDGRQTTFYNETDKENPLGVYGETKLNGEKKIANSLKEHFIIRTSWLYSEHGHNFLKTMLRLGQERDKLSVVADQIGTPTYAGDLAKIIIDIIISENTLFGTYHYSNEGVASWYDFAKTIFDESQITITLSPIKSEAYPTPAERPKFSVMDKTKIKEAFDLVIPYWRDSLQICLDRLNAINQKTLIN